MRVDGDYIRGYTESIILSVLEEKDSYGYQINSIITERSKEKIMLTEATLYTTFKKLEKDELIVSYWQDGINAKRKYYSITEKGVLYLQNIKKVWKNNKKIIDIFLEDK